MTLMTYGRCVNGQLIKALLPKLPRDVGEGLSDKRGAGWEERWGIMPRWQDDSSFKLAPFPPTARLCLTGTAFMVSQVIDQLKQLVRRPNKSSRNRKYKLWRGAGLMMSLFKNCYTCEACDAQKKQMRTKERNRWTMDTNTTAGWLVFLWIRMRRFMSKSTRWDQTWDETSTKTRPQSHWDTFTLCHLHNGTPSFTHFFVTASHRDIFIHIGTPSHNCGKF